MQLIPGDIIKTNYGTGPYEVLSVMKGCTCPTYTDELNGSSRKTQPRHLHITCCEPGNPRRKSWLNHYVWTAGGKLMCLRKSRDVGRDEIIIEGKSDRKIQLNLF